MASRRAWDERLEALVIDSLVDIEKGDTLRATAIGKLELNNIVAPYELLNLTLSQVGIDTITVPTIAVA